ncbi:MAG: DUF2059 domain-containing protein [Candidatus Omnitrophica bacterium]|nr:DUF2059 domain-containing protein [Candidatus Omnitrophota bacterium]
MRKILVLSFTVFILSVSSVFAQVPVFSRPVSAETKELVRALLEANGMRSSMIRIFEDIISQAPAESQKDLRAVLKGDAIIDNMIPVYASHFSNAEIKELINFYKSPVGAKNLSLTPVLMTEVMQVSQKYFEESVKKLPKPAQVPAAAPQAK